MRLLDGATGTELARRGFELRAPAFSAAANLEAPALVSAIAADYATAGAAMITTNTTCAHRHYVGDDVARQCRAAVALARLGAPSAQVAGAVAMLPAAVEPIRRAQQYRETAIALVESGIDVLLLESFVDLDELARALEVTRGLHPRRWAAVVPTPTLHAVALAGLEVEHVALHCAALPVIAAVLEHVQHRVIEAAYPSCAPGQDDDAFAAQLVALGRRHGLAWIGACCGSTPATIAALARALAQQPPLSPTS